MRRAEANTCYAYTYCHNGETSYGLRMVGEVEENWHEDETYNVCSKNIYYEAAGWTGIAARRFDGDKLILKRDYDRIKNLIENARRSIMESLKDVGRKRDRELRVGDCLFNYFVDHEEWYGREDNVKHVYHEESSTCYKILEISEGGYKVIRSLIIDKNYLHFEEVVKEYSDDYDREGIENALLIDESQYLKAMTAAQAVRDEVIEKIEQVLFNKKRKKMR